MNPPIYDVNYFINKFTNIPDKKWCRYNFVIDKKGQCCALGHCGETNQRTSEEADALSLLFRMHLNTGVAVVNDGVDDKALTPKLRIINALERIKAKIEAV